MKLHKFLSPNRRESIISSIVILTAVAALNILTPPTGSSAASRKVVKAPKQAPPSKAKKPFALNLCELVSDVSALNVIGPCIPHDPITHVDRTPAGTVTGMQWIANWGKPGDADVDHSLTIIVTRHQATGAALKIIQDIRKQDILANGTPDQAENLADTGPVAIGDLASLRLEDEGCANPPTNDCVHGNLEVNVGQYYVSVLLADGPPTNPGPDAHRSSEPDEPEDKAFHDALVAPLTGIGIVITAKLETAG